MAAAFPTGIVVRQKTNTVSPTSLSHSRHRRSSTLPQPPPPPSFPIPTTPLLPPPPPLPAHPLPPPPRGIRRRRAETISPLPPPPSSGWRSSCNDRDLFPPGREDRHSSSSHNSNPSGSQRLGVRIQRLCFRQKDLKVKQKTRSVSSAKTPRCRPGAERAEVVVVVEVGWGRLSPGKFSTMDECSVGPDMSCDRVEAICEYSREESSSGQFSPFPPCHQDDINSQNI